MRCEECFQATGRAPIKLRWVDINKGDELHPKYRSRIVAKEIKIDNRPELFAATPPLEFIKYFISRCASRQRKARPRRLMIQDMSKAYFFAPATKDIYIELPPEDEEPGWWGSSRSRFMAHAMRPLAGRRQTRKSSSQWATRRVCRALVPSIMKDGT